MDSVLGGAEANAMLPYLQPHSALLYPLFRLRTALALLAFLSINFRWALLWLLGNMHTNVNTP